MDQCKILHDFNLPVFNVVIMKVDETSGINYGLLKPPTFTRGYIQTDHKVWTCRDSIVDCIDTRKDTHMSVFVQQTQIINWLLTLELRKQTFFAERILQICNAQASSPANA